MKISKILLGAAMIIAAPVVKEGGEMKAAVNANAEMKAQLAPQNPLVVDTPMVHDPVMAYENGKYYLYCTGHGITQMTSTDRKHWTLSREGVLKNHEIPAWTHDSVPGFETHIWAPDVIRFKNKWYLAYSCSTFGKNTSAIGLLSNTSLSDKDGWKDEGCLVASKGDRDNWNAIDPNFIVDEKGNPWLTWGSFWDGIQMIKLDKKTMHVVSWDYCCRGIKSNYRVAVGRSRKVAGPYLDKEGKDMRNGGGTLLLEGDKKEYEAMGHCSAYSFPDGDYFFCHGYSVPKNGASILVQKKINWTNDGWLTLE